MPHLPPGENWRYFCSSTYATCAYLLGFWFVIRFAVKFRGRKRDSIAGIEARLAFVVAAFLFMCAAGHAAFQIAVLLNVPFRGTIRNYSLGTLGAIAAWFVGGYLQEIIDLEH